MTTPPILARTISTDGVPIAWHTVGASGPDLLVVHGAMQTATSQLDLAMLLADRFRVHLIDRRGRGDSGPAPARPSTGSEVDDLRVVLDATGARRVLGISSGAIIAARAALVEPGLERLALFEPPLGIHGSIRLDMVAALETAVDRGDLARAMAIGMKTAEMGPAWMFGLPLWLLAAASRPMLRGPRMRALAAALRSDFAVVRENADSVADFAAITVPTLLIDGTATRPYLRTATAALARAIPTASHVELPMQSHSATQNRVERGRPDVVAPPLLDFFG